MRATIVAILAIAGVAPPTAAQSLFDGNWKGNPAADKLDPKPNVYALKDGTYSCTSYVPAYAVPADGKYHAIPNHPYADETSITATNGNTLTQRNRKGGKVMDENVSTLSPDGNTTTIAWKDFTAPNGQLMTGIVKETRIAPAPPGAHAISGSWRVIGIQSVSDAALRFTLATHGDAFRYSDPTGQVFEGRFGGPYAPIQGDPAHTMAKVERISATAMRETQMRDGKVVSVADITVSPDGHTLTNVGHDLVHNTTSTVQARKE